MVKEIEIPEGYEAKIEDNKVIFVQKESEDDRIRKWILEKMQAYASSGIPCSDEIKMADKAIDYLEKQKDASKAVEAVERIDKYIDEHLANAHDMKDSNPDKKYYCGWDDALGKMAGILQDVYSDEKQKEQKPVEQLGGTFTSYDMAKTFTEGQNYVIAHPEKFGLCKPAEWSEEFLRLMGITISQDGNQVCVLLGENLAEGIAGFGDTLADAVEEFKKEWRQFDRFRKATWKPSKEQMKALFHAVNKARTLYFTSIDGCPEYNDLHSLYEQLKNLM